MSLVGKSMRIDSQKYMMRTLRREWGEKYGIYQPFESFSPYQKEKFNEWLKEQDVLEDL